MARRTRIIVPLLGLIVGLVLVVGLLASRSQEDRVLTDGETPRPAQTKEAGDIDVRVTDQGLRPRSAVVRQGQIVQWRNDTRRAVRFVPAQPGDQRSQGLASSLVPAGGTYAFRPVEPGRIAYRAAVEAGATQSGSRGVLEVR